MARGVDVARFNRAVDTLADDVARAGRPPQATGIRCRMKLLRLARILTIGLRFGLEEFFLGHERGPGRCAGWFASRCSGGR